MTNRVQMYMGYKRELEAFCNGDFEPITEQAAESDVKYVCEKAFDAKWIGIFEDSGKEIGFIILAFGRNLMRKAGEPKVDYFIQETYIKPEYRRKGIMSKAVQKLLDDYKGIFGLYILKDNKPALDFWHKIIGDKWVDVDNLESDEGGAEYAFDNRKRELND